MKVAPRAAYRCETCPLPAADPGPDGRASLDLYQVLNRWPEGDPRRKFRWDRFLEETDPDEVERRLADFEEIRAAVEEPMADA